MHDHDYLARFGGIQRLYGTARMDVINTAHICVIGIGGVGSWAVEALARSGVGNITLIDHDDIAVSNINRQLHSTDENLNLSKALVMADRVRMINPSCTVEPIDDMLTENNLAHYLAPGYDYVIDCIDTIRHKVALIVHCRRHKVAIIISGGAGGIFDPTRIRVTDLSRTVNDPLAAKVRHALRSRYGFTRNPKRKFGIDCVFSDEQPVYHKPDGSICHKKPGVARAKLDCNLGYGSVTFVTGTFGFIAVGHALKKIIARANRKSTKS